MMNRIPQEIRVNKNRDMLTLIYSDGEYALSAEFLRVLSPSAEVRGHGMGQEKLQTGKRNVLISDLAATGNYALKITFSDGHDSGLYDWDYLDTLCQKHDELWQNYLDRVAQAGASREPSALPETVKKGGCGGGSCGCSHG